MAAKSKTIDEIDLHYSGGLKAWEKRHKALLALDKHSKKALHISASQLFESHKLGYPGALVILDKVIACNSAKRCFQILCPACRVQRQEDTGVKALAAFGKSAASELKFMTLLIQFETNATQLKPLMDGFRNKLKNSLRNNARKLGVGKDAFKMLGAFEVDLKNLVTHWDLSPRSRKLVKGLGYNPKVPKNASQYLLHIHAIVAPLDDRRKDLLIELIAKSLGLSKLLPHQINFRSLHAHRTQDENLKRLASYMFKARLQFADNIFDNNLMQKTVTYKTPFQGKSLIDYLDAVDAMGNFKGLKFDFGI